MSEKGKYIYRDYKQNGKVIFETQAACILEADKAYKNATGNDPAKQTFVGCEIPLPQRYSVSK